MRRTLVIHPFLLAVFPVLFLFATNIEQFGLGVLVVPVLFLLTATALLWGLLTLVLKNARKAGLIMSLFLLLFFSYGHVYGALPYFGFIIWGVKIDVRHVTFLSMAGVFLLGSWLVVRRKRDLGVLTRVVNVSAAVLVAISVFNIAVFGIRNWGGGTAGPADGAGEGSETVRNADELPDIYYIILDAYARQDTLKDLYDYNNTDFLDYLKAKGFYVAEESTSNYPCTLLSFASSLNMDYLDKFVSDVSRDSDNLIPLIDLVRYSAVRRFLKEHGYTMVAFASGFMVVEMTSADVYITPGWFGDEFPNALIEMTPIGVFSAKLARIPLLRRRTLGTLDRLATLPGLKSPKFVFAHMICPHPPFVFGPEGQPVDPKALNRLGGPLFQTEAEAADYRRYYRDQVIFLNTKVKAMVDAIIERSERPPVIIIQGDHGPDSLDYSAHPDSIPALRERFAILNAYYLPGKDPVKAGLYPDISPVNSFRVVFNNFFGTSHDRLEARCFLQKGHKLYHLTDVTDLIRPASGTETKPLSSGGTGP